MKQFAALAPLGHQWASHHPGNNNTSIRGLKIKEWNKIKYKPAHYLIPLLQPSSNEKKNKTRTRNKFFAAIHNEM
jgi:hypothetical protein